MKRWRWVWEREGARGFPLQRNIQFRTDRDGNKLLFLLSLTVCAVLHIEAIKCKRAQLQICCHCRRTIYETVGSSKQL